MTTLTLPSRTVRQRLLDVTGRALARFADATARTADRLRPADAPDPARTVCEVSSVADPDGAMCLIGVRGTLDRTTVERLGTAVAAAPSDAALHLDLSNARIRPDGTLERIEVALELAERRRVRVRVVGLDPEHPALVPNRPR